MKSQSQARFDSLKSNTRLRAKNTAKAYRGRARRRVHRAKNGEGKPVGFFGLANPIKVSNPEAVRSLQDEGIRVVTLTVDDGTASRSVAQECGIDGAISDALPDRKAEVVRRLQKEGRVTVMVGGWD